MFMVPEVEKLQKANNEFEAKLKEKDDMIRQGRSDLGKISLQLKELELKYAQLQESSNREVNILRDENKKSEQTLTDFANRIMKLEGELEKAKKEAEEAMTKAETIELERNVLLDTNQQLASGAMLNPSIRQAVMNDFFSSKEWGDVQMDNFVTAARDLKKTIIKKHPEVSEKLSCISFMTERLTSSEKKKLLDEGKELPQSPDPPSDSEEEQPTQSVVAPVERAEQGEVNSAPAAEGETAEGDQAQAVTEKANEGADPAVNEHVEVTSSEIFGQCESIAKF